MYTIWKIKCKRVFLKNILVSLLCINYSILLTNSGHLLKYCPLSQLLMLANEQDTLLLIDELMVMECNGRNIEFLILTKCNEKSRSIKMIDYPCKLSSI